MRVAADVADALALDRLLWIPAGQPPHKSEHSVSRAEVRLAMVSAAVRADRRFEVAALELEREGPSYTIDTVRDLRKEYPVEELFLVMGADQVAALGTWRDPEGLAAEVRFAVMDRGGRSAAEATEALPDAARIVVVPVRRVDVSSTEVRRRVRGGLQIRELVPPPVREIIERERLYS